MKRIASLLFALLVAFAAHADSITMEVSSHDASNQRLDVTLNATNDYTAFQMDLTLPEGLEVVTVNAAAALSAHLTQSTALSNGKVRILAYSNSNATLPQGSSLIFSLNLRGSVSQSVEFLMKNIRFSLASGTEAIFDNASCTLEVAPPTTYTLTYEVDGQVYSTEQVPYGTTLTPLAEPTREGHTFSGWSQIPATMPASNVTVTGSFSVNSYTLTYEIGGEAYHTEQVPYGTTLTPLAEPTREGHTFSGWSQIPATMPASDVMVTGSFIVNSYTLTYEVDGEVYHTEQVPYGTTLTPLAEPTREGAYFSGWSQIPTTMPAHDVTISGNFSASAIKTVATQALQDAWFTIQGQRLADKPTRRGLYIHRGKKVWVR